MGPDIFIKVLEQGSCHARSRNRFWPCCTESDVRNSRFIKQRPASRGSKITMEGLPCFCSEFWGTTAPLSKI
jgi:hypothetical protein